MADTNQSSKNGMGKNDTSSGASKEKVENTKGTKFKAKSAPSNDQGEVLIKVGGLEYREPGRRQRLVIASIFLGLNLLLVIAAIVFFYSPEFRDLVFNLGRN